jgi:hypothetical protein
VGGSISKVLTAAVEIDDLDLPAARKLHVMVYAMAVVFLHCLSLAVIDPRAASL